MAEGQSLIVTRRTKLHRPRLPVDLVTRAAVLDRLSHYQQRPFTLVSAPAGYGKSTLVSAWIETWARHYAWLSLDEQDNDLHQFLTYLLVALQQLFPSVGLELQSLLSATDLPPISTLASLLSNELDQCPEEFILVLDDYHFIHNTAIHDLLTELLRYPPAPMHLFITTRRDPPLPLSTLRAQGLMTEVRAKDLRFSVADTAEFLRLALDDEINEKVAVTLEAQTEGWISGLRLASLSLREQGDNGQLQPGLQDNRYLMDYLMTEVLSRQPTDIQNYLFTTAILDRFCAPLCEAVRVQHTQSTTQEMLGQEFITWLEQTNLFVIPLDNRGNWFRYHHLFQQLLQERLKAQYSPDDLAALYKQASTWFADHNLLEEAFQYALASEDTTVAAQLVVQHRHELMNQELWVLVDRWLGLLPTDLVTNDLELLILKAWSSQNQYRLSELVTALDRIDTLSAAMPPAAHLNHLLGEASALRSYQYYQAADGERTVFHAQQALELLPAEDLSERGFAVILLAGGYQMVGEHQRAETLVQEALSEKEGDGTTYHARLLITRCFIRWMHADLPGLQQAATQYLQLGEQFQLPETIIFGRLFLGLSHYHGNELSEAEQYFAPTVRDKHIPNAFSFIQSTFALSLTYHAQGRLDEAHELAESALSYLREKDNTALLPFAEAFHIDLALRQGRMTEASRWAQQFTPEPFVPMYLLYVPQLTWARTLLAQETTQSLQKAKAFLSRFHDFAETIHNTRLLIEVLALQAQLHHTQGNEAAARAALQRMVPLACAGGLLRFFADLSSNLIQLLPQLDLDAEDARHAEKLVEISKEETADIPHEASVPPPAVIQTVAKQPLDDALTDRELEVMGLLVQRMSNKEIASQLFISAVTVKRHTINIYQKLDVNSRRQAVAKATELGLLVHV